MSSCFSAEQWLLIYCLISMSTDYLVVGFTGRCLPCPISVERDYPVVNYYTGVGYLLIMTSFLPEVSKQSSKSRPISNLCDYLVPLHRNLFFFSFFFFLFFFYVFFGGRGVFLWETSISLSCKPISGK